MGDLSEAAELELLGDGTDDLHHDHDGIDEADILLEDSAIKREETELYDDAIAPSNTSFDTTKVDTQNLSTSSTPAPSVSSTTNGTHSTTGTGSSGRKYCCYIGNMTWWTTDHDLQAAFTALSIADLIDIKFFENRLNGQSKGYCLCVFGSEASVKNIMDNLPKRTVHAQSLLVLPYTKASLARFEEATARSANKDKKKEEPGVINMGTIRIGAPTGPSPGGPGLMGPSMGMGRGGPMGGPGGPGGPMGGPAPNMMGGMGGMMGRPAPGGPVPLMLNPMQQQPMMGGPVQMRGPGPVTSGPPGMMGGPGGPGSMMNGPPGMSGPGGPMGGSHGMPNMSGPPPQQMPPVMNAMQMQRPPMQMQQGPPGMGAPLQQNPMMSSAPPMRPPVQQQPGPPGMPPGAHINPQVYPGFNAPPPGGLQPPGMGMMQPGMRPMGPGHGPGNPLGSNPFNQGNMPPHQQFNGQNVMQKMNAMPPGTGGGPVSEGEFEEIMNRNRTVSSSAISRAVSDASTGDVESAVETLLTAINLIKQSRVAHDERCKVLIISLQDTLAGIESKAAGGHSSSRKHRRDRDRSRSRSRDRDRKRHRRSRSRSRSRDYDRRGRY